MDTLSAVVAVHPTGEAKSRVQHTGNSWPVDTPGGRFYAEWDTEAPVTREGQLIFFFQFLRAGGRWKEFLRSCPLTYTGNRGSGAPKVMGNDIIERSERALEVCAHERGAR